MSVREGVAEVRFSQFQVVRVRAHDDGLTKTVFAEIVEDGHVVRWAQIVPYEASALAFAFDHAAKAAMA